MVAKAASEFNMRKDEMYVLKKIQECFTKWNEITKVS